MGGGGRASMESVCLLAMKSSACATPVAPLNPPALFRLSAACVAQICALAYFASTFVPGGIGGMNMMSRFALAAAAASTRSLATAATR